MLKKIYKNFSNRYKKKSNFVLQERKHNYSTKGGGGRIYEFLVVLLKIL